MTVTGYLALYTTVLGWQQYNNLWELAVGTGIIYLPFVSIILSNTFGPFTSMGAKDAAQIAVRRLTLQIMSAFFVIAFAAAPTINLDPKVLHYEPLCNKDAKNATPGHTGTTYDNSFNVPTGVKVPLFWYLVMAISNGITHAASQSTPCAPLDLRTLHTQLDTSTIQDPRLKQEVSQFYSDCYAPAYSTYMSGNLPASQESQIEQSLNKNGKEDVAWLGSQTFQNISGLYDAVKATKPVDGFAFDAKRDVEAGQVANHSANGQPNCKEWWSDPTNGLSTKLKQAFPPSFTQQLMHLGNPQKAQDVALKKLITHSFGDNQTLGDKVRGYESLNDNMSGDYVSRFVGAQLGIIYEKFSYYPKLHLLINALPVIQGSLLFAIYAFLALAIPFSSYRINFCVSGAVVLFSLIFCSYIWHLVGWLDTYLIQALYPSVDGIAGLGILSDIGMNQTLVDMIIGTLYVLLPILWMSVMGWAGFQAGQQISNLVTSMTEPAHRAGAAGGNIATKRSLL